MIDRENHVARLRVLAEKLSQHPSGAVTDILATVLGTNAHTMDFPRYLVAFEELVKRSRLQVNEISDNPSYNTYAQTVDNITNIFDRLDMRTDWSNYAGPFTARALAHLETCDHAIAAKITTIPPSEDAIRSVLVEIGQATASIEEADIEPEAKELFREMLLDAEYALKTYHISGLTGLRRVVERIVGTYALNKKVFDRNKGNTAAETIFKALGRFVLVAEMIDHIKELPGVDYIIEVVKCSGSH